MEFVLSKHSAASYLVGVAICLALWTAAAERFPSIIVPSPEATVLAAVELVMDRSFWSMTVLPTLSRALVGGAVAATIGIGFGLIAGYSRLANGVLEPPRLILSAVPAPVLVILLLLWFGTNDKTIILSVAILLIPLFFVASRDGLRGVDTKLVEMATVYRLPLRQRLSLIVAPALAISILPATRVGVANGLRLCILAEILVASSGLGEEIALSRQYLETEKLFALVLLLVLLIVCLEWSFDRLMYGNWLKP